MPRLYDRIIHEGLRPPLWWVQEGDRLAMWAEVARGLGQELRQCEVIVADNVAEYFYAGTDQEVWEVTKDFPCVAPPFETFWIEYRRPSRIVSRETGVSQAEPGHLCDGVLFTVESFESRWRQSLAAWAASPRETLKRDADQSELILKQIPPERQSYLEDRFRRAIQSAGQDELDDLNAAERFLFSAMARAIWARKGIDPAAVPMPAVQTAWYVTALSVVEYRRHGCVGPLLQWQFEVDGQGQILREPMIASIAPVDKQDAVADMNPLVFPALLTLSFLNCKNVRRTVTEPPAALGKKYQKRTGKPLCRFWTLEIEPMKALLRREGENGQSGLKKALHICRGHFAVYEERPLFGRYRGRFWRPSHVRGSIKEGVIDKIYEMGDRSSE